jgi:Fe-S oxidoreductase
METKKGERFSDIRLEQAIKTGDTVLAVSCPYCRLNFDDSILSSGQDELIKVMDVAELVEQAL